MLQLQNHLVDGHLTTYGDSKHIVKNIVVYVNPSLLHQIIKYFPLRLTSLFAVFVHSLPRQMPDVTQEINM